MYRLVEFNRQSLSVLAGSVVAPALGGIATLAFPVFLTPLSAEFGGRGVASALYMAAGMAGYVGMYAVGCAVDRWGARRVLPQVLAFSALMTAMLCFSAPLGLSGLFVLFVLVGLGNSTTAACSKLNAQYFHHARGLAFALSALGVGMIWFLVIPRVASALLPTLGWRQAYGVMGVISLVLGQFLLPRLLRHAQRAGAKPERGGFARQQSAAGRPAFWQSGIFWLVILAAGAEASAMNGCRTHLVAMLTDRGASPAQAASVMALSVVGMLIGQPLAGWVLDRSVSPRVALPFLGLSLAGLLMLGFGSTMGQAVLGVLLMNMGYAGEMLMFPFFLIRYFGANQHGRIYGSMFLWLGPINAFAPVLMGLAYDHIGNYHLPMIGFALAMVAAGCLLLMLPAFGDRVMGSTFAWRRS